MGNDIDQASNRSSFARQSIRLAIGSILRTAQVSTSELNCFYTYMRDTNGHPLVGLDRAAIADAAEKAIQTYEPLVTVRSIDVEMTPAGAVAAITVHYRTAVADELDDMRVEFSPAVVLDG